MEKKQISNLKDLIKSLKKVLFKFLKAQLQVQKN